MSRPDATWPWPASSGNVRSSSTACPALGEHLFIDAGTAADKTSQFDVKVGIGAGVRYRSPVGPLQLDLAYGLDKKALRLHLSVGFTF